MPVYSSTAQMYAVYPGEPYFQAINAEASSIYPSGTAAARCALGEPWNKGQTNCSVELIFSGNPGAFEIDVQSADTDATNNYQTIPGGAITSASQGSGAGTTYSARAELQTEANFIRPYVKAQPANAVTITCNISN